MSQLMELPTIQAADEMGVYRVSRVVKASISRFPVRIIFRSALCLSTIGAECPARLYHSETNDCCSRRRLFILQRRSPVQQHGDGFGRLCRRVDKETLAIGSDVPTENLQATFAHLVIYLWVAYLCHRYLE
jgi:hypothetical protein